MLEKYVVDSLIGCVWWHKAITSPNVYHHWHLPGVISQQMSTTNSVDMQKLYRLNRECYPVTIWKFDETQPYIVGPMFSWDLLQPRSNKSQGVRNGDPYTRARVFKWIFGAWQDGEGDRIIKLYCVIKSSLQQFGGRHTLNQPSCWLWTARKFLFSTLW